MRNVSDIMRRIAETTFPAKYTVHGTQRYVTVPVSAVERMGLHDGDYLDVTIRWPRTEEFEIDEIMTTESATEDRPRRGRKTKTDDE